MEINYTATLLLPALTSSIGVIGKDADITVKLDGEGNPYFSGKHIKGILKERVRQFKNALGDTDIDVFLEKYFGKEGNNITEERFQKLRFFNLILKENTKENLIDNRYGIRVDRKRKTVINNSLFNYEFLKTGTVFEGKIECSNNISEEDLKFLLASLYHLNFIGGLKSRGIGKVEIKIENKEIKELNNLAKKLIKENRDSKIISIGNEELEHFSYTLKLEEPIILKEKELGNYVYVRDSIQGSTIRGAMIEYFLNKKVDIDSLLKIEASQAIIDKIKLASTFKTKYEINGEKIEKDKVIFEGTEYEGIKLERGSLSILEASGNEISIEIDKKLKSTKDSMIFNTEYIYFDKELKGELKAPKGIIKRGQGYNIYLGKIKSKGFGKATITFNELKKENNVSISNRIEKLNKQLEDKKSKIITFDLMSDMILPFNEIWNVSEQFLEMLPFENDFSFNSKKSFINTKKMSGYNIINNSRKMDELILCRGSVITYNTNNYEKFIKELEKIELNGIGLRKNEGFGEVKICSIRGEK